MITRTKGLSDWAADDLPRFLIQAENSFLATVRNKMMIDT